jgi:hypothetical protein
MPRVSAKGTARGGEMPQAFLGVGVMLVEPWWMEGIEKMEVEQEDWGVQVFQRWMTVALLSCGAGSEVQ